MPRRKSLSTIQKQIDKTQQEMVALKKRYDELGDYLLDLNAEYEEIQALIIADKLKKSGKTFEELMTFLER
ncbi:MAG: hypothetical protein Q4E62_09380 [Sutterellaceae bacterium]|nr:hypothetical protein [Sutterellaceae bacterium]